MQAQLSNPSVVPDVSGWADHDLRTVYFDFTQRGLGDPEIVEATLREWVDRGTLRVSDAAYWLDAIAWRSEGGLLPGWTLASATGEIAGTEADERRFREWRTRAA